MRQHDQMAQITKRIGLFREMLPQFYWNIWPKRISRDTTIFQIMKASAQRFTLDNPVYLI